MTDVALLILRIVTGCLLIGHGSQKLFGWFGGPGLAGAGAWFESIGLRPGRSWAALAGLTELGGGLLMAVGFLNPLGPIAVMAAMAAAWLKAHWGKPIWATAGGGELPATYLTIALALALAGPGAYSLDASLGVRVPGVVSSVVAILAAIGVIATLAWPARSAERARADRKDRAA
ncbi:MAG: DoxX family protein [Candidatus Rokubacteria bacterium 13_1_40CM_68_15]|nr:MAG: DoxX family protein [Candidatus Rokubacteria bacterium 13_1_40CM_68_15]